jgi:hypothetical protein
MNKFNKTDLAEKGEKDHGRWIKVKITFCFINRRLIMLELTALEATRNCKVSSNHGHGKESKQIFVTTVHKCHDNIQ